MTLPSDPPPKDTAEPMLLLNAHVDGELDAADSLAFEHRVNADPALQAEQARLLALKAALQRHATQHTLPAELRTRLQRQFAQRPARRFEWQAMAASMAITAMVASAGTYVALTSGVVRAPQTDTMGVVSSIVAGHQRSLLAEQPVDVVSSDRHTVKPWLSNKLATSPPVVDLADQGFTLIGGRVDIVAGRPAPTLVYRHREHLISLTVVPRRPGEATPLTQAQSVSGYNVLSWQAGDFSFFAVSDMLSAELADFSRSYRQATP
jgi:anti-sigma factor RsiW